MSHERATMEELRKLQKEMFRELTSEHWNRLSSQQKAFFELVGAQSVPINVFIVRKNGVSATMSAKDEAVSISVICTEQRERQKGRASQLLKWICMCADQARVTLVLWVEADDSNGLTEEQLSAWYRRYAFTGSPSNMTRKPLLSE